MKAGVKNFASQFILPRSGRLILLPALPHFSLSLRFVFAPDYLTEMMTSARLTAPLAVVTTTGAEPVTPFGIRTLI